MTPLLLSLLMTCAVWAAPPQPAHWTISAPAPETAVARGAQIRIKVSVDIDEGWHIYSLKKLEDGPIPTTVQLPKDQPAFRQTGPVEAPPPVSRYEETFQMQVESYEEEVEFLIPVEVANDAPAGAAVLKIEARYQSCDNKQCLPPRTVKLELPLVVK